MAGYHGHPPGRWACIVSVTLPRRRQSRPPTARSARKVPAAEHAGRGVPARRAAGRSLMGVVLVIVTSLALLAWNNAVQEARLSDNAQTWR